MEENIVLEKEKDTEYATQRYHRRRLNAVCLLHLADCSVFSLQPANHKLLSVCFLGRFFFLVPPSRLLSHDQSRVN